MNQASRLSALPRVRRARHVAMTAGVLGVAVLASVSVGSSPSTLAEIWHALFAYEGTTMDVTIHELRWPRTVLGLVVGVCLGLAGMLVQGHTRNPIADPGLLGIFQGAALAIVGVTAVAGAVSGPLLAVAAFAGALVASVLVFAIASGASRGVTPITLVLAGAAVSALFAAIVTAIVLLNEEALDALRFWQIGSLAGRNGALDVALPFVVIGILLAVLNVQSLNALALGEDAARSLGVSVLRARSVGIVAITLLGGAAVMLAGPIAFAGLIVPHLARWLVGADYRWLLPTSALCGAIVLLVADSLGRVVARPGELSVGVVLAVIGAPFFVMLARRRTLVAP